MSGNESEAGKGTEKTVSEGHGTSVKTVTSKTLRVPAGLILAHEVAQ